jgi:hypothetical protein
VVEARRADVVGPAVPADDPDAAPDQVIGDAAQVSDMPVVLVQGLEPPLQLGDPVELGRQLRLAQLRRAEDVVRQVGADHLAELGQAAPGQLDVPVGG